MDIVFRLLSWLLIGASFVISYQQQAHAETIPATVTPVYSPRVTVYYVLPGGGFYYTNANSPRDLSKLGACGKFAAGLAAAGSNGGGATQGTSDATNCRVLFPNYSGPNQPRTFAFSYGTETNSCAPGSTATTHEGQNVCSTPNYSCPTEGGWTLEGVVCTRSDCFTKAGQTASQGLFDVGTSPSGLPAAEACNAGCRVIFDGRGPAYSALISGTRHYYYIGEYTYIAEECSSGGMPNGLGSAPPDTCGAGQGTASMNGVTKCIDLATGSPVAEPAAPPKEETKEEGPSVQNPDGSTTQTTTTNHSDGSTTTTTTTTNPDGTQTTTTTTTPPTGKTELEQYCDDNPDKPLCKEEEDKSSWSGSCGSFQCEGDAVQCAISRKLHQDRCDDRQSLDQFQTAIGKGEQLLNGQYGSDVDAYLSGNSDLTDNVSLPAVLSETGQASLAAGGLQDISVSFQGQVITLPLSQLNNILEMLGYIILACAYISALRIVGVF